MKKKSDLRLYTVLSLLLLVIGMQKLEAQDELLIDSTTFSSIINKEFSKIVNGQPKALIGNFASLDIKDAKLSFNGSRVFNDMTSLTLNASGGIDGGTYAIFNNSKINSNIALEIKFSSLLRKKSSLGSYLSEIDKRDNNLKRIDALYKLKEGNINNQLDLLAKMKRLLIADIAGLENSVLLSAENKEYLKAQKKVQLDSINLLLIRDYYDIPSKIKALSKEKKKALKEAAMDFEITRIKLQWFEIGYKVVNKSFSILDKTQPLIKQITKENFTAHNVSFSFNKYRWSNQPFESFYWQLAAGFFYDNNRDDLVKNEVTETTELGSPPISRSTTKKFFTYSGDYKKNIPGIRFSGDYYQFLFKDNFCAAHIYPEAVYKKGSGPVYSLGLGFMYSFKDKKDETGKTLINAELYLNLIDMGNARNIDKTTFERNEVGLRFGLPLKFFSN